MSDLARVDSAQLRIGMYVADLGCGWLHHGLWRRRFLITSQAQIDAIVDSKILSVWIDTSKGLGPSEQPKPIVAAATLSRHHKATTKDLTILSLRQVIAKIEASPRSLPGEFHAASSICSAARHEVNRLYQGARLGMLADLDQIPPLVDGIIASLRRNPDALLCVSRSKTAEQYSDMHAVAVSALMAAFAMQLGLSSDVVRSACLTGLLLDIGMSAVSPKIINRLDGRSELHAMGVESHVNASYKILGAAGIPSEVTVACLLHHERVDGRGYPNALRGAEIPILAKMARICDSYDALISPNHHHSSVSPAVALREMQSVADAEFDRDLMNGFIRTVGAYPVGTLISLTNGKLAVVVRQNRADLFTPTVKLIYSKISGLRMEPELVDLSKAGHSYMIEGVENASDWRISDIDQLWSV